MFIFFCILLGIITYIVGAGITHGYAKHRWPSDKTHYSGMDDVERRALASLLWPLYWSFIWPFTKSNEIIFSHIEKNAALEIARKKSRIEDLHATRAELEAVQADMEKAEIEVEKAIAKV